ncbi:PAS domain-containing sensor histidine kinase [Rhizobium grahamii]|uniref:histidine kinase n=2 Tax=Rhizobium grahamii TaxID=1120045 RepID=A0A370KIJ6_9HYPH|nr:PAS domain-containing sensor histidine kinase [Rhizobium grahamii]
MSSRQAQARSSLTRPLETDSTLAAQLADNVPTHLWSADPSGRMTYTNRSMQTYFGGRLDQPIAYIHPDDRKGVVAIWRHSLRTGEPFDSELRLRRSDGQFRRFHVSGRPFRGDRNYIAAWHGQSIDIEDEKLARENLLNRIMELSIVVDMVPSNLWRLTPDGTTTLVNKHMADFLGREILDESTMETVMDTIFHPDDAAPVGNELGRCLITGDSFAMRYRLLRKDGIYRWMSGRAEPMRDKDGQIVQWFGLCHDIHDQVQAEENLRRTAERLAQATQAAHLAELSASIAHEVNQPLSAIATDSDACTRWLSLEPPNVERAIIAAGRITTAAVSAGEIVRRIRALFQHISQPRTLENANLLIDEVCRVMVDEIGAHAARITTDFDMDPPSIAIDRVQVQQVLVNLIRNALQSMDRTDKNERVLHIVSWREGHEAIRIEIRDSGSGFSDITRIFEPFFTTRKNGMGMGLSICRSIIESHGGRFWVANNEGGGATVGFTLPIEAEPVNSIAG